LQGQHFVGHCLSELNSAARVRRRTCSPTSASSTTPRFSYPSDLWCGVVHRYHGSATISQGAAVVEGDCTIESVGGPLPGPDPAWLGILQDPAPEVNLVEGGAWLRLADGRECEIQVERVVAGSGVTEFSGAKGILDLH
jgi:hypothetical protein